MGFIGNYDVLIGFSDAIAWPGESFAILIYLGKWGTRWVIMDCRCLFGIGDIYMDEVMVFFVLTQDLSGTFK